MLAVMQRTGRSSLRFIAGGAASGAQRPCSHNPPAAASTSSGMTATQALQTGTMCLAAPWADGPALPWPAACSATALAVGPRGPCARLRAGVPQCCTLQTTIVCQQLPGQLQVVEPAGCTSFAYVPWMLLGHEHQLALLQCTEAGDHGSRCWQPLDRAADCRQPTGHALHRPNLRCYGLVQECAALTDMKKGCYLQAQLGCCTGASWQRDSPASASGDWPKHPPHWSRWHRSHYGGGCPHGCWGGAVL